MAPPRIRKVFSGFAPDLQIDLKGPCKEENQPSIKTLLPNHTESVECISVDQEGVNSEINVNKINNSSTVRSCTDTDYASSAPTADQTLNDTELTGFKEVKLVKKRKRKSRSSEAHKTNHQRRLTLQKLLTWMAKDSLPINPTTSPPPQLPWKQTQRCPCPRIIGIRKTY